MPVTPAVLKLYKFTNETNHTITVNYIIMAVLTILLFIGVCKGNQNTIKSNRLLISTVIDCYGPL